MEAIEPMENSSAVASSFPTKRKTESDPAEENEESSYENEESSYESEESSDEFEESRNDQAETPEWDVDSFDGCEYDSSSEEEKTEYIDKEDVQDWLDFRRQHIENKGFYVDQKLWPMYDKYSHHSVIQDLEKSPGFGRTYREFFKEMACLCLKRFNQENFIDVEFVKVVGGVVKPSYYRKCFITFMAKEKPGGPEVDYQAKVWSRPGKVEYYPILCRRAPPPKTSN